MIIKQEIGDKWYIMHDRKRHVPVEGINLKQIYDEFFEI